MIRLGIIIFLILATVAIIVFVFAIIPSGEREVVAKLKKLGIVPSEHFALYQDTLKVRYKIVGDLALPKVILIHGSPGEWSAWVNLFTDSTLRMTKCLIAVDRAGYGGTQVPALASLKEHGAVVWKVIAEVSDGEPVTLVGHSYGGAVVEQLLLDHPGYFDKAVLVAPTLSPVLMEPRWYNKFASFKLINWLVPHDLRCSNTEMIGLPVGLKDNEPLLSTIDVPIIYIQGKKDILVPHQTVDYYRKHKPNGVDYVIVDSMNHFTPWSHPQLIIDAILRETNSPENGSNPPF